LNFSSFLITNFHTEEMYRHKLIDFVIHFMEEIDKVRIIFSIIFLHLKTHVCGLKWKSIHSFSWSVLRKFPRWNCASILGPASVLKNSWNVSSVGGLNKVILQHFGTLEPKLFIQHFQSFPPNYPCWRFNFQFILINLFSWVNVLFMLWFDLLNSTHEVDLPRLFCSFGMSCFLPQGQIWG